MSRQKSRPQRWADAVAKLQEGYDALRDLMDEYEEWQDNLQGGFENSCGDGSPTMEKLDALQDLDLDDLQTKIEELEQADLPRGYGRD